MGGAVYRWLLYLYPPEFRRAFGEEMEWVFGEADAKAVSVGGVFRFRFYAREIAGMLGGAVVEQLSAVESLKFMSRRFSVVRYRNGFRFPMAGIAFMAISLGLVLWAIRNAQTIANSFATKTYVFQGHTYSYEASNLGFAPSFVVTFALTLVVTVAVYVVIHRMRRSGVHRLSDAQTWPQQ
jgi:hypothetical protein